VTSAPDHAMDSACGQSSSVGLRLMFPMRRGASFRIHSRKLERRRRAPSCLPARDLRLSASPGDTGGRAANFGGISTSALLIKTRNGLRADAGSYGQVAELDWDREPRQTGRGWAAGCRCRLRISSLRGEAQN